MDTITVTGIVLSAMPVGETDRRVVILTKEQGCISAFARGACRPKSPLVAVSRPFATGEFTLIPRRDSYNLHSAVIKEYFDPLLQDLEKMAYGCVFLEEAGYFAAEEMDATDLLNLLFLSLRALQKGVISMKLIRLIFEYRLFMISGEYPQVFQCSKCKAPLKKGWFSMVKKAALCDACSKGTDGERISESVTYTLQYILSAPLTRLYSFRVSEEVFLQLESLLKRWKKRFFDREFKSEMLLEQFCSGKYDELANST